MLHSIDDGQNWTSMTVPTIASATLQLNAVDFADTAEAFVVGENTTAGEAVVFEGVFNGTTISWRPVSPIHAEALRIHDVATSGTTLDQAYIVGNDGLVMQWDGTDFVGVPGVYEVTGGLVTTRMVGADLFRVGVSPGGGHVLIGSLYAVNEVEALEHGWLIRDNGSGWEKIRSHTGEDIRGICLQNDGTGYLLAQSLEGSGDEDHGNLADALLLYYGTP